MLRTSTIKKFVLVAIVASFCTITGTGIARADWLDRNWDFHLGYYHDSYSGNETLGFDYNIYKTKDHSTLVYLYDNGYAGGRVISDAEGDTASFGFGQAGIGLEYRFLGSGPVKPSNPFVRVEYGAFEPTATVATSSGSVAAASGTEVAGFEASVGTTFSNNKDFVMLDFANAGAVTKDGWGIEYGTYF